MKSSIRIYIHNKQIQGRKVCRSLFFTFVFIFSLKDLFCYTVHIYLNVYYMHLFFYKASIF